VARERILVVEPDEVLLKTISEKILLPDGFKPFLARDQEQGLDMALTESPDLLLLHLSLDSSAYLLHGLAQKDCLIPTILIIEQESTQIAIEFLKLGVRDYVAHPFTAEDLLQTIHRVLGQEPDTPNYQRVAEGLDKINRELEQRLKEFDVLFQVGQSVNSLLDLDAVLNRVTEAAVFMTGAEEGYLLLLDEETGELRKRAAQNLGKKDTPDFSLRVSDSIAGRVVRSGKPILLGGDDNQSFKIKTGYLVKSLLNVPLKVDSHVIGVLGVDNQVSTTPFTSAHLKQLSVLADMAATALENARHYTEMRQKLTRYVKEFATLQAITDQLSAVADFDMKARLALSLILNAVDAEAGVLAWVVGDHEHSPLYISQGTLGELVLNGHHGESSTPWWNDQVLQEVLTTDQPILKNNFNCNGNGNGAGHTRSQLAVPMRRGKQVVGAINLESSLSHIFTQNDLYFVSNVANQVAIALEGTMLREKAEIDRESLSLLMSIVDNAVWLVDTDLKVLAQNEVAGEMVGSSSSEAVGRSVRELLSSNDHVSRKLCQLFSQAMEERQPVSFDKSVFLTTKENLTVFAGGKIVPITRDDQTVGALCAFQKIPAEKSNKYIRLEFANMASHLLRTPLSFIQTSIDLLMNSDLDPEEQRLTLDRMWEGSQRLTEFTDELLEMLRLETEEVHVYIEPVALLPLIERVLDLVRYEKPCHHFNLVGLGKLPMVAADLIKTELVLFNLLTSAVNRCSEGGHITIEPEIGTSEVNISIIDDGESVPANLLDRVFGQFYPVDDENGKMPSTYQLGLYTARRLVELQNGRIWAKNQPEQGAQFGFSLPIWENKQ
jgi:PAS domain S-box-containing protein